MKISIAKLDEAIVGCLADHGIEGGRYVIVVWGPPGSDRAAVASNVHRQCVIEKMLTGALDIITRNPDEISLGEIKGHA